MKDKEETYVSFANKEGMSISTSIKGISLTDLYIRFLKWQEKDDEFFKESDIEKIKCYVCNKSIKDAGRMWREADGQFCCIPCHKANKRRMKR